MTHIERMINLKIKEDYLKQTEQIEIKLLPIDGLCCGYIDNFSFKKINYTKLYLQKKYQTQNHLHWFLLRLSGVETHNQELMKITNVVVLLDLKKIGLLEFIFTKVYTNFI